MPTRFAQSHPQHRSLAFIAASSDTPLEATTLEDGDNVTRLFPDAFLASSENGFSLSRSRGESAWRCTVIGGLAGLEWF